MVFKKKSVKQQINKLAKKVSKIAPPIQHEPLIIEATNITKYQPVASTTLMDAAYSAHPLTTLPLAVGDEKRLTNRVKFKKLSGRIFVNLNSAAGFNTQPHTIIHAWILKIKKTDGSVGAHTHPVYTDVFTTQTPTAECSAYNYPDLNLRKKDSNYDIVWNKAVKLTLGGAATVPCGKRGMRNSEIQDCGSASQYTFQYELFPKGETTFDGDANAFTSALENHYVLYVGCSQNAANNVPQHQVIGMAEYTN